MCTVMIYVEGLDHVLSVWCLDTLDHVLSVWCLDTLYTLSRYYPDKAAQR